MGKYHVYIAWKTPNGGDSSTTYFDLVINDTVINNKLLAKQFCEQVLITNNVSFSMIRNCKIGNRNWSFE